MNPDQKVVLVVYRSLREVGRTPEQARKSTVAFIERRCRDAKAD